MAQPKRSCLRRLAIGCGALVGLAVLVVLMSLIGLALNRPEAPDITDLNTSNVITAANRESGLNLPDDIARQKPVRLTFDVSMVDFEVTPGGDGGEIAVEGKYDQANFELATDVVEKDDYIDYKLKFKSKKSLLGLMVGAHNEGSINNRVLVRLPKNLLYDMRVDMRMGEADMELGGLAVENLDVKMSMGEMNVAMGAPNQTPMEKMKLRSKMGETTVRDLQNFGFAKGEFRGRMGELRLGSSGPLQRDVDIYARMTMGEMRVSVPENARFVSEAGAFLGEYRGASEEPTKAGSGPAPVFKLKGGVTMGEIKASRGGTTFRSARFERANPAGDLEMLNRLRQQPEEEISLSKDELNRLGYRLLRKGQGKAAVEVFELNVKLNPEYANGWDSLGEGYMAMGLNERAIASYEKAVELDPAGSGNARTMLRELRGDQE